MAWRVGNGASSWLRYSGALPAAVNSYTILGTGIIRVNRGAASRLIMLFDGLSGQYNVIQTDGPGTGLIFDPGNGAPLTSAVTVGIDVKFYWAIRVNGTGAGAASMHIRLFGSSTVTKVSTSNTNTFAPTRMDLGDSGFDERFDGELGNVIVYNSALSDAEIEAQFGKRTPQVAGYAAWYETTSTDLATSMLDATANNYDLTNEGATVTYAANFYDGNVVEVGNNTGDSGDVQDAEIYQSNPTDTLGADAAFYIGRFGAGDLDRTVLRGDFSSIPAGATIVDATLFIWQSTDDGGQTYQIGAHKLLVPFVEAEVSWNNRALTPSTTAWATAGATGGADSVSSPSGLGTFNASNGAYKPITGFAALVQDWVSNSSSNHGVLLKAQSETPDGSYKSFVSSEGADGNRPYWSITYLDSPSPRPVFATPFTGSGPLGAGPVGVFQWRLQALTSGGTPATGTSAGAATASGQGSALATGNGSSSGTSAGVGEGKALVSSVGASAGAGAASGQGRATVLAVGSSSGASTAAGDAKASVTSIGSSSASATAAGDGKALATATGASPAGASASGEGRAVAVATGASVGQGATAGEGRALALANGTSAGAGTAAGQGAAAISAVGASSGVSTATGQGAATARADGTSSGAGTAAGQGRATALGVGASQASSTAAGEGKALALANASSAGSSAAAGQGVGAAPAVGSSAGTATAAGEGKALARGNGASPGASTAAGEGKALALATGTSAGTSTASGSTGASSTATGTSTGTSTVTGEGRSLVAAVGTAPGTSTATGVARSLVMATGSSSGTSTADGVSGSALPPSTGTSAGSASTSGQGRATALGVGS